MASSQIPSEDGAFFDQIAIVEAQIQKNQTSPGPSEDIRLEDMQPLRFFPADVHTAGVHTAPSYPDTDSFTPSLHRGLGPQSRWLPQAPSRQRDSVRTETTPSREVVPSGTSSQELAGTAFEKPTEHPSQEPSVTVIDKIKDVVTNLQRSVADRQWENEQCKVKHKLLRGQLRAQNDLLKEQLQAQNDALHLENQSLKAGNEKLQRDLDTQRLLADSYAIQAEKWRQNCEDGRKVHQIEKMRSDDVNGELKIKAAALERIQRELLERIEQLEMDLQIEQSWNKAEEVAREEFEGTFSGQASTVSEEASSANAYSLDDASSTPIDEEAEDGDDDADEEWEMMNSSHFSRPPSSSSSSESSQSSSFEGESKNEDSYNHDTDDEDDEDDQDEEEPSQIDEEEEPWYEPSPPPSPSTSVVVR